MLSNAGYITHVRHSSAIARRLASADCCRSNSVHGWRSAAEDKQSSDGEEEERDRGGAVRGRSP